MTNSNGTIVAYTVPKLTDYSAAALEQAANDVLSALLNEGLAVQDDVEWKSLRDRWMARKNGILTQINDLWLKAAPKDAKRNVGEKVNELKVKVESGVQATKARVSYQQIPSVEIGGQEVVVHHLDAYARDAAERALASQRVDITLPGIRRPIGAEHPVMRTSREMVAVFQKLGYSVAEGPVIETDYYNFEALNFPPNHPARDTQDTLFIAGQQAKALRERLLLRTHTSPVQIRTMEKMRPPIRIVIPGTVHRNDPPDASHSPMFHQIEGLAVDTNITFGDLKGTLDHAMKEFFGSSVKTSFRPSFFPFTEPSAEMFVSCFICGGSGQRGSDPCRPCKQTGWIEILGCGMVDPNVFEFVMDNGYDPKKISGFAFGMGADRIALLKYGVDDLQAFFQGDVRFLQQFG
ncbi:MAG TPA: phenylalanine--tRNA ligase subunit alpha [Candidatus Sulfotelmatobacter sp.]|nr:phenylalanine--tRNA ligase subunit alpha [Candidatus Sulfotelmatobacter sp.]